MPLYWSIRYCRARNGKQTMFFGAGTFHDPSDAYSVDKISRSAKAAGSRKIASPENRDFPRAFQRRSVLRDRTTDANNTVLPKTLSINEISPLLTHVKMVRLPESFPTPPEWPHSEAGRGIGAPRESGASLGGKVETHMKCCQTEPARRGKQ